MRIALGLVLLAAAASAASLRVVDAVKSADRATVLALLGQHADVNEPEADGTTALAWAARMDDLDLADRLLRAGAKVDAANRYGVTPLYLACVNGSAPMIERLLQAGAGPNAVWTEGETPLMTVARTGSVAAARVLLAHGAKVNASEPVHGQTPLMWAAGESHPDMVRELIAHGADVNARSAIQHWERQVTAEPREKWLPPGGFTALHFAARQGCLQCAQALAEAGADLNATDPDGNSAVVLAIINGHYDLAGYLIDKGTDPNLADVTGRAALYAAVDFNTMPNDNRPAPNVINEKLTALDLIQKLIDHGANVNAQLKKQAPYRAKLDRGDDTMLTTGTTPLLRAAKAGDIPAMKLLLAHGADVKLATRIGINPLMAAAGLGTKEEDTTGRHKTEAQAIEAIQLCLDHGSDINAKDTRGQTALYGAALKGYDQVAEFLVEHGAKVDLKDNRGLTAIDAAAGKAGGLGFDGAASQPHPTTVALLEKLAQARP
ncbi:MAG TPA: ankyrin repeat domain-containing protein [Bryobacteraceae bacterium]|nr:ankyrin repeat domain-containing protein [Bryobacteraceae bacterium]